MKSTTQDFNYLRNIAFGFAFFMAVVAIGTAGYVLILGLDLFDAFYNIVITVATLQVMDLEANTAAKVFTLFIVVFGMGDLLFLVSTIAGFFADGEFQQLVRRRKMRKRIENLKDHFIVCGDMDEIAEYVVAELQATKRDIVIVCKYSGRDQEREEEEKGRLYINGNPEDDEVLLTAGIKNARGIICVLHSDQDNVFVVLTARGLNPDVRIVAKCVDTATRDKLIKAGADAAISPDFIGGLRMVSELVRPTAVTFLDKMIRAQSQSPIRFEDIIIAEDSEFAGKTIADINISQKYKLLVVGIMPKNSDDFHYTPSSEYQFNVDDTLVVLGDVDNIGKLRKILEN